MTHPPRTYSALALLTTALLICGTAALVFDPRSNRPGIIERAEDKGIPFFPSFGVRFWF